MSLIADIWSSFRRLPGWVQIWVALILVPVNMAALLFIGAPGGLWVALLAVGGMVPNLFIMIRERGLSKAMALPHLVIWTPLIAVILVTMTGDGPPEFRRFLWLLLAVDALSLGFDYPDALKWARGDRKVA